LVAAKEVDPSIPVRAIVHCKGAYICTATRRSTGECSTIGKSKLRTHQGEPPPVLEPAGVQVQGMKLAAALGVTPRTRSARQQSKAGLGKANLRASTELPGSTFFHACVAMPASNSDGVRMSANAVTSAIRPPRFDGIGDLHQLSRGVRIGESVVRLSVQKSG